MARILTPPGSKAVQLGEERLFEFLGHYLPDNYTVITNPVYPNTDASGFVQYMEYDCLVVAPHGIYHLEDKYWAGDLGGDENTWWHNGKAQKNPLKGARYKSVVLHGYLERLRPEDFGKVWVDTAVTLSHPSQDKSGFSESDACYKRIFLLDDELISYLTSPAMIKKSPNAIASFQDKLAEFLVGASQKPIEQQPKEIQGYKVKEILNTTKECTEYLCESQGIITATKLIKVFNPPSAIMTTEEKQQQLDRIRNQKYALDKIGPHPHIQQFTQIIEDEQVIDITDYYPNASLDQIIKGTQIPMSDKISIVFDICSALKKAHAVKVIHRAISPESIYYIPGSGAYLTNFTNAFFEEHTTASYTVQNPVTANTVSPYHSPEMQSKGPFTPSADIYSFGVVIYELFVGKLPIMSFYELNKFGGKLPSYRLPTRVNGMLPKWLDEVASKTICFAVEDRWQSIDELHDAIKSALDASETPGGTGSSAITDSSELKPGRKITQDLILGERLGKGGYSQVFKVHHSLQNKDYAIKVFNESVNVQSVIDEFEALKDLKHPNIVKFVYNGKTDTGHFFTLMELLQGDNLQKYAPMGGNLREGALHLPLLQVYQMAEQILDALVYLQKNEKLHRDIKPQNIIWDKQERFVLVDFNIATDENGDAHHIGTEPYIPPDLIHPADISKVTWDKSADTFALGITLYQLACQCYPWGNTHLPNPSKDPIHPIDRNPRISQKFATFLLKAISCKKENRFGTAAEMLQALQAIGKDAILASCPSNNASLTNVNTSEFIRYLNSLYSQSRFGNSGTRTGNVNLPLDDATYINTKLDIRLLTAICDGEFRLVIITGNAGDGKTAFVRKIEAKAKNRRSLPNSNGATFEINGITYRSNYDGSQDEGDKCNDDVLREFFSPFENCQNFATVPEGRIIAINEGKLADFLEHSPEHSHLSNLIAAYFHSEGKTQLPSGLLVLNLNLRSVTASEDEQPSLFKAQLKRLCNPDFWRKCQNCSCKEFCFIKYNVDTFNDSAAGDEIANRLEWVLRMISYRRELHITIRDLRSALAFMITGDERCENIPKLYNLYKDEPELYWRYHYFNLLAADGVPSQDRLIEDIRKTDVANVAIPNIDKELYFTPLTEKAFLRFAERQQSLLAVFNAFKAEMPSSEVHNPKELEKLRRRQNIAIRHHFFEGNFEFFHIADGFFSRLPYKSLQDFHKLLSKPSSKALADAMVSIAKAVTLSEGCRNPRLAAKYLLLASNNKDEKIARTFRRFPLSDFEMCLETPEHLITYLEYENGSVIFRNKNEHHISLKITLDLYEMLFFIQNGFSPSVNDLQGHFIELQVFKTLLANKLYTELLVTRNNKDFSLIQLNPVTNQITLKSGEEEE